MGGLHEALACALYDLFVCARAHVAVVRVDRVTSTCIGDLSGKKVLDITAPSLIERQRVRCCVSSASLHCVALSTPLRFACWLHGRYCGLCARWVWFLLPTPNSQKRIAIPSALVCTCVCLFD